MDVVSVAGDKEMLAEALSLLIGFCGMGDILTAWDPKYLYSESLIRVIDILSEHQDDAEYTIMDRRLNQIVTLYG